MRLYRSGQELCASAGIAYPESRKPPVIKAIVVFLRNISLSPGIKRASKPPALTVGPELLTSDGNTRAVPPVPAALFLIGLGFPAACSGPSGADRRLWVLARAPLRR